MARKVKKAAGRTYVVARKYIVEVTKEVQGNSLAEAVGKLGQLQYDDFSDVGQTIATADETAWVRDSIEDGHTP